MPSDMRSQCPSEETPPSTRPPSVASSSTSMGTPHRSTSMDSLHTNSSTTIEKPSGEEYIPTRMIKATPKANALAMQFIKTGPAVLYKSAKDQMKKAEVVKSLRKTSLQEEEEEWQTKSKERNEKSDDAVDWQANLDKWKTGRRKRNEEILERVIEVKRNEQAEEYAKTRRKSKTFNEMREDKNRRGRRYNLVIHDDDNNDLSDLGLTSSKKNNGGSSSAGEPSEEGEAKSDAGFCTGSDTGSDGVFPEDISDTSSALGDKREVHDSLLDSRISPIQKTSHVAEGDERIMYGTPQDTQNDVGCCIDEIPRNVDENHNSSTVTTKHEKIQVTSSNSHTRESSCIQTPASNEYTYDKAIEDYKQFAENSAKKRLSASVSSNLDGSLGASNSLLDDENLLQISSLSSAHKRRGEKVASVTNRFIEPREFEGTKIQPRYLRKERLGLTKVDISKRRSMFELRDVGKDTSEPEESSRLVKQRKSVEISDSLKNKVASFENIYSDCSSKMNSGQNMVKDSKFKEKLANFGEMEKSNTYYLNNQKKTQLNKKSRETEKLMKSIENINISGSPRKDSFENADGQNSLTKKHIHLIKSNSDLNVVVNNKANNRNFSIPTSESAEKTIQFTGSVINNHRSIEGHRILNCSSSSSDTPLVNSSFSKGQQFSSKSEIGVSSLKDKKDEDDSSELTSVTVAGNQSIDQESNVSPGSTTYGHASSNYPYFISSSYVGVPGSETLDIDENESLTREYGDQDIDEVIDNFDLSPADSTSELNTWSVPGDSSSQAQPNNENKPQMSLFSNNCYGDANTDTMENLITDNSVLVGSKDVSPIEKNGQESTKFESPSRSAGASSPIKSTKEEMRKKMSAFLGTDPPVVEECSMKPPPDVSELLRRERESERLIVQKQASLRRESPPVNSSAIDSLLNNRSKYTWEDRMKADDTKITEQKDDLDDSGDQFEFHTKLAELELEMEKHDREMMQRVQGPTQGQPSHKSVVQICEESPGSSDVVSDVTSSDLEASLSSTSADIQVKNTQPYSILPYYSAPAYKKVDSPSSNVFPTRPFPATNNGTSKSSSGISSNVSSDLRMDVSSTPLNSTSEEQPPLIAPRKKNIRTLSALPKPKLVENESWITKRKAEAVRKDYNKHWLIQEAEQRRVEQQERIIRPSDASVLNRSAAPSSTRPVVFSSHNHKQNLSQTTEKSEHHQSSSALNNGSKTAFQPLSATVVQHHRNMSREHSTPSFGSSNDSAFTHNSTYLSSVNNNSSTSYNNNGSMRKSPQTYQPPPTTNYPPSTGSNKPLPDAIIDTITQRVHNKNKINANSRARTVDDYSDYANSDAFPPRSHDTPSPTGTTGGVTGQVRSTSPCPSQQGQNRDDQCLLSVSGKKKCSHCSEELGRGAAMIIESLRLFYHIPCFKCCVCGVQLGNGTSGADVRVRNHKLHCHNCYSNDEGMKFSKV